MAKFKVGDRVRLVGIDGCFGFWDESYAGKKGVVEEEDTEPYVRFDDGTDRGSERYLERVDTSDLTITVTAELTHITIGGKRFRLVAED